MKVRTKKTAQKTSPAEPIEKKHLLRIGFVIGVAICGWIASMAYAIYRDAELAARRSCLLSILCCLADSDVPACISEANGERWIPLNAACVSQMVQRLYESGPLDCAGSRHAANLLIDPWKNPVLVYTKTVPAGREWRFMSAGPDGRLGTDDDFVAENRVRGERRVTVVVESPQRER